MPIRFAREPQGGSDIVRAGLDTLAAREGVIKTAKDSRKALTVESPHVVYDLRADEIASGGGLETAHVTGLRYLVKAAGQPVAAAEVRTDASGRASLLAHVNYGPFVGATTKALEQLQSLDSVRRGSYEARLLRFSAVYVMAIWLKADAGGADIIYPLAPTPSVLQAGRPYSVNEFLRAIRPLAQKRAQKTGSPRRVP